VTTEYNTMNIQSDGFMYFDGEKIVPLPPTITVTPQYRVCEFELGGVRCTLKIEAPGATDIKLTFSAEGAPLTLHKFDTRL
jgi:hypothetical protein